MYPSLLRIWAMLALILECGKLTSSWYAELALRRRVKKSAIGSVIVMTASVTFLAVVPSQKFDLGDCRVPVLDLFFTCFVSASSVCVGRVDRLPAALLDAGQLPRVRHLAQADPAEP